MNSYARWAAQGGPTLLQPSMVLQQPSSVPLLPKGTTEVEEVTIGWYEYKTLVGTAFALFDPNGCSPTTTHQKISCTPITTTAK